MESDLRPMEKDKSKKQSDTSSQSEESIHISINKQIQVIKSTSPQKILSYFEFFQKGSQYSRFMVLSPQKSIFNDKRNFCENQRFYQLIQNLKQKVLMEKNQENQQNNEMVLDKKYSQFLQSFQKNHGVQIIESIIKSKKFEKMQTFTKDVLIHQIFPSKHHEIIRMQIQLLWFKTQIIVLNQLDKSSLREFASVSNEGAFGKVYFMNFLNQKYCVKSIAFDMTQNIKLKNGPFQVCQFIKSCQTLISTLRQYFFHLLFSQLQIGPKVHAIGGFDIIIYKDSIEFATEICNQLRTDQESLQVLKESLFTMHMLQVVHRDIKPMNVMFSPTFNKNVFIDFGGTEVLKETLGEKTFTKFVGTASYCSQEAFQLLSCKLTKVDLYFNDVYGLKKSIREITSQNYIIQEDKMNIINRIDMTSNLMRSEGNSDFEFIQMKYSAFIGDEQTFDFMWRYLKFKYFNQLQQIERKILQFLKQLKPTQSLRRFYKTEINEQTKNFTQFLQLKRSLKNKNCEFLFHLNVDSKKSQSFNRYRLLFKTLKIQYGNLSQKQRQIQRSLINKISLEISLQQINTTLFDINTPQQTKKEKFLQFCFLVAIFCCISQNSFKISLEEKIKMSENALQIIKQIDKTFQYKQQILFTCPKDKLNSICIFYHYFFFHKFHQIPKKYQSQMMIKTISSLCLLGLPTSSQRYLIKYFLNHIISQNRTQNCQTQVTKQQQQQERLQKILLFWQCKFTFMLHDKIFYRLKDQQIKKDNQDYYETYNKSQLLIMKPKQDQINPFFKMNYLFYVKIFKEYKYLHQREFSQLLQILKSLSLNQLVTSSKLICKWKKIMCLIVCYFSNAYKIIKITQIHKLIEKQQIFEQEQNKAILPYSFFFYFEQILENHLQLPRILQKIDEIIGCKQISLRFGLEKRLKLSLQREKIQEIKQIFQMILKQIKQEQFCPENVESISKILKILSDFLIDHLKNLPDLNEEFINLLQMFRDIINLGIEIGIVYFQENKDEACFKDLEMNPSLDSINFNKVEKQIYQKSFTKYFAQKIIFTEAIYDKITDLIGSKIQNDNSILLIKPTQNLKLPQKYSIFISNLQKNQGIFKYCDIWIDKIKSNQQLRQKIRQNRKICLTLVRLFLQLRNNKNQIGKSFQAIQILFADLKADQFLTQINQNQPNFLIAIDYFQVKLIKTNYELHWCNEMIKMYQICLNQNILDQIMKQPQILRFLFNSYIYTNKTYSELQNLISDFTKLLKKIPSKKFIQQLKNTFQVIFWCQCKYCFPRKPQNWSTQKFTQYLYSSINISKVEQNPYMSLVYFYNMKNKTLSKDMRKKFILYILKSIPLISPVAKDILFPQIYEFIYATIEPYPFEMVLQAKRNPQVLKIPKVKYKYRNQKTIHRYLYLCNQFRKHQQGDFNTLEDLSQKRLVREYCVLDYKYPPLIREKFVKKLKKYHEIKQNYRQKQQIFEIVNSKNHFLGLS